MNIKRTLNVVLLCIHKLYLLIRKYLPRQRCSVFNDSISGTDAGIQDIYVINLDREPIRWGNVKSELHKIRDHANRPLSKRAIRHSACDARAPSNSPIQIENVDPYYTLAEQLFVDPQPHALPDAFDLVKPIKMSNAEIAVANSHIDVWRKFVESDAAHALILEDDILIERGFGKLVEQAWKEIVAGKTEDTMFDVLYFSYKEVTHGAPKELISKFLFRPERGLWYMSGYVLSKRGATRLLQLLPCRGPVDLWINHKFAELDVKALRRSVISQRLDLGSTNSYSILPMLTRIGIIDGGEALFHHYPACVPVFAFGDPDSGLSSLAMALSMLGFRCCSDLDRLPKFEMDQLCSGSLDRVFTAYVNIQSLTGRISSLRELYPYAKFIVTGNKTSNRTIIDSLQGADVIFINSSDENPWRTLCEHLRVAPPQAEYPYVHDVGQRICHEPLSDRVPAPRWKSSQHDTSPWVVPSNLIWSGIMIYRGEENEWLPKPREIFTDTFIELEPKRWHIRTDTFPGNQALFRSKNVSPTQGGGINLIVQKEELGVRDFSAAAISSCLTYHYGRFEVTLQSTNVSGLVTGFFLYRDSPRQEIDIEITGDCPSQLLINVFYNPGIEGAKFDYGYRGTPIRIPLGFDASKGAHRYAIEWSREEIRWFVDDKLVYCRVLWDPTPIPDLPMTLHVNTWPTRSRELAGSLDIGALPACSFVKKIHIDAIRTSDNTLALDQQKSDLKLASV